MKKYLITMLCRFLGEDETHYLSVLARTEQSAKNKARKIIRQVWSPGHYRLLAVDIINVAPAPGSKELEQQIEQARRIIKDTKRFLALEERRYEDLKSQLGAINR